jgi:hypothetical protein
MGLITKTASEAGESGGANKTPKGLNRNAKELVWAGLEVMDRIS